MVFFICFLFINCINFIDPFFLWFQIGHANRAREAPHTQQDHPARVQVNRQHREVADRHKPKQVPQGGLQRHQRAGDSGPYRREHWIAGGDALQVHAQGGGRNSALERVRGQH